jgi:DNA-binding NtrC family response regulator
MVTADRQTLLETGLASARTRGRTAVRSCMCRVTLADRVTAEVPLGARPLAVGAGRECDLVLEDPQVSRRHAELALAPEGIRVRDLGSTNGTFWQSSRVTEAVVPFGSQIKIGAASIRFLTVDAPALAPSERRRFGGMVGSSVAMRELFAILELAAPTEATVLLEGESGTGKEMAARALHDHSPRARVPLVVVDCSAISEALIDSHLFGHVRGAFTGAEQSRKGAFVEAAGGTVFLDEIGELPLSAQAKLLRVLEARTVQPVGSDRPVPVDARVVAATHRDLSRMVEEKAFRFDLFYRLAVVHVALPPLRERPEDLAELVRLFYEGRGVDPGPIAGDNLTRLERYAWPGNVRELRNVLERAWTLSGPGGAPFQSLRLWMPGQAEAPGSAGRALDLIDTSLPFKDAKERWLDIFERRYLEGVFATHGENISRAAAASGINRRHFRNLLRKHGIIQSDD